MFLGKQKTLRYPLHIDGSWQNAGATVQYHIDADPLHPSKRKVTIVQKEPSQHATHEAHLMLIDEHLHLFLAGALHKIVVRRFLRTTLTITFPGGQDIRLFRKKMPRYAQLLSGYAIF